MGRPFKGNTPVVTRVSPAVKSWLVTQAAEQGVSLAAVLRQAIQVGQKQMTTAGPGQGVNDGS